MSVSMSGPMSIARSKSWSKSRSIILTTTKRLYKTGKSKDNITKTVLSLTTSYRGVFEVVASKSL